MQLKKCQETPRNSEVTLKAKQGQHQQDRRASLEGKGRYEGWESARERVRSPLTIRSLRLFFILNYINLHYPTSTIAPN